MTKLIFAIILFPVIALAGSTVEERYYENLKEYLSVVNEEIQAYKREYNKYPSGPDVIKTGSLNPYPEIFYIEEYWWMLEFDHYSISVGIRGLGKVISCSSGFKNTNISCIRVNYDE